jgi:hypothetical protein
MHEKSPFARRQRSTRTREVGTPNGKLPNRWAKTTFVDGNELKKSGACTRVERAFLTGKSG